MTTHCLTCTVAITLAAAFHPLAGQNPAVPRQLSLADAIRLARTYSPVYRTAENNADPASAAVRQAQFALLPTVDASGRLGYTGAGSSTFGGTTFNQTSPSLTSGYSISANWSLSPTTFLGPAQARAQERAAESNVAAAAVTLTNDITTQYLTALRAQATLQVAQDQVATYQSNFNLAQAKFQVGQGTQLDVTQARVNLTNAQVTVAQDQQAVTQAKITLLQHMGVPMMEAVDSLQLTEQFPLTAPTYDLQTLLATARQSNPSIVAATDAAHAADIGVRAATYRYFPSFNISTGFQGYTQQFTNEDILLSNALHSAQASSANCSFQNDIIERLTSPLPEPNGGIIADCNDYAGLNSTGTALDQSRIDAIKSNNEVFPFQFARQPWSISLGISLPIWDGFSRALQVSQARATADNAQETVRQQRLATDAQVQQQLVAVRTSWQTAQIQDSNRVLAHQQLELAQEKYRIGNGTALDVVTAEGAVATAEGAYITAVYNYHMAAAALEAAVGHPLH
jgi:outer membrane protein